MNEETIMSIQNAQRIYRVAKYIFGAAVLIVVIVVLCGGCMAPVTVNVFSSRLVVTYGTNTVNQQIDGGARTAPNVGLNGDKAIAEAGDVAKGMLVVPVAGDVLQGGAGALLKAKQIDALAK